MIGESPTRPGTLYAIPLVEQTPAGTPAASCASTPYRVMAAVVRQPLLRRRSGAGRSRGCFIEAKLLDVRLYAERPGA